jgi:hypothetical protein
MHRGWGSAAREVVLEILYRFPHLAMFREEERDTSGEDKKPDSLAHVSHVSKPIIETPAKWNSAARALGIERSDKPLHRGG